MAFDLMGNAHCAWPLLRDATRHGSLMYSFGIGEDISFDLAAIARYSCLVHGFDPTPRSIAWLSGQDTPPGFHFHPVGIGDRDDQVTFFPPANSEFVSYSAEKAGGPDDAAAVKADVRRLQSLVAMLATPTPDILKMDIEGYEYRVIDDIIAGPIRPAQLLVEFHHGNYNIAADQTRLAVAKLQANNYKIFYVSADGRDYGFALV